MTETEWIEIFRKNLVELMAERGYSQGDLSESIGVADATISRYLNGERIPNIKSIVNLAYELDVPLDDLIDFGDRIE